MISSNDDFMMKKKYLLFSSTISIINLYPSPVNMALEFGILQILINAEIKLVGQEQIIYFILELEQVGKRQGFAYQCDIHIGKRLVGSFDP